MEKDQEDHPAIPPQVRLACRVSYLGSRFYGSQIQEARRTVEGEFVATCRRLDLFDDWRDAGFSSAGRTDRGVHALGQVVVFFTPYPDRACRALNLQLPPDIWCTGMAEVPAAFHPRYDARSRTYRYYYPVPLADVDAMGRAARHFCGNHNFSNFARVGDRDPWRTVTGARVGDDHGFTYLEVTAGSFLWHQVRGMAAALLMVGSGQRTIEWLAVLLEGETDRPVPPAPAEGLVLWDVDCGIDWTPVSAGRRSSTHLAEIRRHHALMEQVCRVLMPENQ
jgi:tRNA pseudouridine38-40 synthase